eukprot:scaffold679243_cov52-Prasinocladus_malaysianus.AAC.1
MYLAALMVVMPRSNWNVATDIRCCQNPKVHTLEVSNVLCLQSSVTTEKYLLRAAKPEGNSDPNSDVSSYGMPNISGSSPGSDTHIDCASPSRGPVIPGLASSGPARV